MSDLSAMTPLRRSSVVCLLGIVACLLRPAFLTAAQACDGDGAGRADRMLLHVADDAGILDGWLPRAQGANSCYEFDPPRLSALCAPRLSGDGLTGSLRITAHMRSAASCIHAPSCALLCCFLI